MATERTEAEARIVLEERERAARICHDYAARAMERAEESRLTRNDRSAEIYRRKAVTAVLLGIAIMSEGGDSYE